MQPCMSLIQAKAGGSLCPTSIWSTQAQQTQWSKCFGLDLKCPPKAHVLKLRSACWSYWERLRPLGDGVQWEERGSAWRVVGSRSFLPASCNKASCTLCYDVMSSYHDGLPCHRSKAMAARGWSQNPLKSLGNWSSIYFQGCFVTVTESWPK